MPYTPDDIDEPQDRWTIEVESDGDGGFTASAFAVLDDDGDTGDMAYQGHGSTIARALSDLSRSFDLA